MQTPSSDAKWILGAIGGAVVVIIGALSVQIDREGDAIRAELRAEMRAEIAPLRAEMRAEMRALRAVVTEMQTDMRGFDDRIRAVEISNGKVVAILERTLPAPEPPDEQ